ncbi:hypothetical protein C8J56DRAFT_1161729 [Mycena floridula]|nr:hypothetical protein C8J56DRAFT_1161729 [Mycena floridula]
MLTSKLIARLTVTAVIVFGSLLIYHAEYLGLREASVPYFPTHTKGEPTCPPSEWIKGQWVTKTNYTFGSLKDTEQLDEVYAMAGFKNCASNRQRDWHLGGPKQRPDRFPKVTSFEWQGGCDIRPWSADKMVKDLVELGGYLLLGDSLTEGHFFSLSCSLGEHVRAEPVYKDGEPGDIAYIPQQLFLLPDSPLIPYINFPRGFDIAKTPLVTFIRCDFLMRIKTLNQLYKDLHSPPSGFKLFREEEHKTQGPEDYMPIFTDPKNHYSTLIVSTAAWWNTETLTGLKDPAKPIEHGTPELIQFYSDAMNLWATQVQTALFQDQQRNPAKMRKQAVARGFPGGHEDCFNQFNPWKVEAGYSNVKYNWPWISVMNERFQGVVKDYLDIHYLGIDGPARLRPDGHVAPDCLHYAAGTGVEEGWTAYISHYITDMASRGLLQPKRL